MSDLFEGHELIDTRDAAYCHFIMEDEEGKPASSCRAAFGRRDENAGDGGGARRGARYPRIYRRREAERGAEQVTVFWL